MRITIFGATGSVGRLAVEQALEAGHEVVAVTRRPDAVTLDHPALTVHRADAVVVALGAGRKGGIRAAGTRTVVEAMRQTGVRRLIAQSTMRAGDSRGNLSWWWKYAMFGVLLRPAYRDHQAQEAIVRACDLDWTIVRPGAFTDGPRTGRYRHGFVPDDRTTQMQISRADVADFLLRQVESTDDLHRAVGLSY